MSGVKRTASVPVTDDPEKSTAAVATYEGRLGSGRASGPGSGQPSIGASGLAVVGGAVVVTIVVAVEVEGAALDDDSDVGGLSSWVQPTTISAHTRTAPRRIR